MRTYGSIEYDKESDNWVVNNCEPHVSIRLKNIFPKIKETSVAPFKIKATNDASADIKWFLSRYPMDISLKDKKLLNKKEKSFIKNINEIEKIFLPDYKNDLELEFTNNFKLRNYQNQAINVFEKVKRLLLVDDIGLGKTYEAIGACLLKKTLPAAIVVQTHLQEQWVEKIKSCSNLKVHKIKKGSAYKLPKADVYVFKYTQISGWVDVFKENFFKMAVYDEIQELRRGTESNKGSAADVLSSSVEYVLGLTATPIYNYGIEMFNIMEYIKKGCLGNYYEFIREWCGNNSKIVKDPESLGSYLRENNYMLRRTRSDVGRELSKVTKIAQDINHDENIVKDAEELAKKLAITALSGSFMERGNAARQLDIKAREMTGISKAKYVAEFVRMVVETGEPVILAGWHRDFYEIILEELKEYNPLMYTGSETSKQKEDAKKKFISGESKILILSLRSGAGLDGLQDVCSTAIIGELDWSPKIHEQFIGRIDRDGQKKPVVVFYLIANYGSDPIIVSLLGLKNSQSDGITDPNKKPEMKQVNKDKLKELAKSYLNKKELEKINILN